VAAAVAVDVAVFTAVLVAVPPPPQQFGTHASIPAWAQLWSGLPPQQETSVSGSSWIQHSRANATFGMKHNVSTNTINDARVVCVFFFAEL
jgi:hypothetical protein